MKVDILIIGGGPTGLFAAFQAGMNGLNAIIVEALPFVGGQCSALYPEKTIYDIPGVPATTAGELVSNLYKQILPFKQELFLNTEVCDIKGTDGAFTCNCINKLTLDRKEIHAKVVMIASGKGLFEPNRPQLPNIKELEGKRVFYSVQKKEDFAGKTICIAGGGDSSLDWCFELLDIAKKIYLVHRRNNFRASAFNTTRLEGLVANGSNNKLVIKTPYQLHSIENTDTISLMHVTTEEIETINTDVLLAFFGIVTKKSSILMDHGVKTSKDGKIIVDHATMESSCRGIFAIGDIAVYDGRLNLLAGCFAEAAIAVRSTYSVVFSRRKCNPEFSTSTGIPNLYSTN